ncbi:hypothetical protein NP233_g3368 [Leucocoprinus birnbaumii]|uniref:CCHC-type domain-containing protein n=1 Tax=Leucocoprinus birnbaumii TaxID=56174 RepID=A0AAD5VY21_9AGAR|nr:hypothetical protein NP233_g3368 [Leucocoprinus birnbaumii]
MAASSHSKSVRNSVITSFFPILNSTEGTDRDPDPNIEGSPPETSGNRASKPRASNATTPSRSQGQQEPVDTDKNKSTRKLLENRKHLINEGLLREDDDSPTLETIAKILLAISTNAGTAADVKKNTRAVASLVKRRAELEAWRLEEGEIEEKAKEREDELKKEVMETMRKAMEEAEKKRQEREERVQERVDRSLRALEQLTKEVKAAEENKANRGPPTAPRWGDRDDFPPLGTQPQRRSNQPTKQPTTQAQWDQARERERRRTRARQLVLDIGKDHSLANTSNVGKREKMREALKKIGAPEGANVVQVDKMRMGGLLIELNSEETGDWLREPTNSAAFRKELGIEMDFTRRTRNFVAMFVPIGHIDPDNKDHIEELKDENCWDDDTFVKARWIKAVEKRSIGQRSAHMLITLADGEELERILAGTRRSISIRGRQIKIDKDQRIPVRCAKCQRYGHYASDCLETEVTCGRCGETGHRHSECTAENARCANCKEDGHEAHSSECPTYKSKLATLNGTPNYRPAVRTTGTSPPSL